MDFKCAYTELRSVDAIIENPRNANTHNNRQIELLAKNIEHQGWRHPLIISKRSGFLVAGHGRLMAAKKLGVKEVPIDFQDFPTGADEFRFLNSDNEIARLASLNEGFMIEQLKELDLMDSDFELLGLDDFSIEAKEIQNTGSELNLDEFDGFQHQCPKCGFEWDNSGKDNS